MQDLGQLKIIQIPGLREQASRKPCRLGRNQMWAGERRRAGSATDLNQCLPVTDTFRAIQSRLDDPNLPPAVRENLDQHFQHLISLAHNLKQLGVDQEEIDHHMAEIYGKYERALETNIAKIKDIEGALVITSDEDTP